MPGCSGSSGSSAFRIAAAFFLIRKRRIVLRRGAEQRQRVEDLHLVVVRQLHCEALHCGTVCKRPSPVIDMVAVAIEEADRRDVAAFAFGIGPQRRSFFRCGSAGGEFLGIRRRPDRVVPGHRGAPVGHRARRVVCDHRVEGAPRFLVAEGMQQRDRACEFGFDIAARRREVNRPQRLRSGVVVFVGPDVDRKQQREECSAKIEPIERNERMGILRSRRCFLSICGRVRSLASELTVAPPGDVTSPAAFFT